GCVNSGVKMSLIWPELSPHFSGVVPVGGEGGPGGNTPPAANFNPDCTGLNCVFNGSGSVDPDGQIVSYSWDFGDGGSASGVQASHSFAAPGSYQVSLLVEDNEGAVDSEIQTISVDVLNNSPVAAYSFSCDNRLCDFDAGLSSDGDGQIVSYHWDFGDGASAQSASSLAQHAFADDGQYTVQLTVWDDDGESGQAQSTIEVTTAIVNLEPVADYSYSCTDLSCEFDASSSSDPDGTITAYAWDFDEGESVETGGPIKNHIFSGPGDYTVSLEVEDNMGAVSSYAVTISVALPPPANIELSVMAYKQRGSKRVILSWSGASGSSVSIFKDGEFLSGVLNDGEFTDFNVSIKARSLSYQVCETDLSLCSQIVVANF
ncbi:MAG TPA: PKD domain-containing protein, partial [Xanthomonadales bacterium]|nr:PKD domain-containing protein [Xanthomonadales bacterium]